ncbi:MAG: hypothetical protein HC764_27255 [Pleurocapsa sp. CRU_1_2]|nr:hypothetical protein [Pleurocapsa sp. CRU_1_2]
MTGSSPSSTQWRLIDPQGNEVFDRLFYNDATDITTSQTGTYTLLIENDIYDQANSLGSIDYRYRVEKLNSPIALNLGETVTNKLTQRDYTFTLNQNSKLYFDSLTNNSNFKWSLTKADGTAVVNQRRFDQSDASSIADPILNLSAGGYLLKVDGSDTTLNYSFKLSNLNQAVSLALGTQINDSFEGGKRLTCSSLMPPQDRNSFLIINK